MARAASTPLPSPLARVTFCLALRGFSSATARPCRRVGEARRAASREMAAGSQRRTVQPAQKDASPPPAHRRAARAAHRVLVNAAQQAHSLRVNDLAALEVGRQLRLQRGRLLVPRPVRRLARPDVRVLRGVCVPPPAAPADPTTLPFATEQLRTRSSFRSATPLCRPLMEYGSRSAEVHMQVRP